MPAAFNPAVAEVQVRYTLNGQRCMNTLWFNHQLGAPILQATLNGLAESVLEWAETELLNLQSEQLTLREVYARVATPDPAMTATAVPTLTAVGGAPGNSLPNNVSMVVSFRTGLSGRSQRGRNYTLGLVEAWSINGTLTGSYIDSMTTVYESLLTNEYITEDWKWCVYSQYANKVKRNLGTPYAITTVVVVDANSDSQRRRLPGRGQ